MDDKIVMFDSIEAASIKTVTGWVSRDGRFYGDDERAARYGGCTHVVCKYCGGPAVRAWLACDACLAKKNQERFEAMPRVEWDGKAMLYSRARDEFYQDPGDAEDALAEGESLIDLELVICKPTPVSPIDEDGYFADMPDGYEELPDELLAAIKEFNDAVADMNPLSWHPGETALAVVVKDES